MEKERIGMVSAKHLYGVEIQEAEGRRTIEVDADTRGQARRLAEAHGYIVCSVNMVG